jgi:hypothetical protein
MPGASVPSNCTAPAVPGRERVGEVGQDWTRERRMTRPHAPTVAFWMGAQRKRAASEAVELHQNLMGDGFQYMVPRGGWWC